MEQLAALKQAESTLSLMGDRINVLAGKLEDLVFRAQRLAAAKKNDLKSSDSMFSYDLQHLRQDIRHFSTELAGLPNTVGGIERAAVYEEQAVRHAQAVMRLCERVNKLVESLADQARLAHGHIRQSEHKVEAWYLVQETEQLAQQAQTLPGSANKVLIKVSTPPQPAA